MAVTSVPELVLLREKEVLERLTPQLAFEAVKEALIAAADGTGTLNPVVIGSGMNPGETFSIKSGRAGRGPIVGLKVGSYWPGNASLGLAPHGSSILLLDPRTGRLAALVEASRLNGPRTAAADAVAARALARADARTLMLIGAGHQAAHEARALCATLPIERVLLASRSIERAAQLRDRLVDLQVPVELTDVEVGCREADIVVTVTPSRAPLFKYEWLKPGVHVASMGSDQAGKQELPVELLHRARLFCDLPSQSLAIGEFQHVRAAVDTGSLALTAIGDVLTGRADGRRNAEEITVFDSSGLALQDLYVAEALLRARA
ncbi:MAG TPA: ornithine cyclodeaminase family protein [Steroidobacteraceae bacterium]|nr:ornithine cyclodeaminase family protein [Steroidobacteraceae bacterium]